VGPKRFFKKHYLLLLCLGLFLLVGFFVGTKKVLASYGSSIYKFFYMGIVPMPPPVILPPYEVVKEAFPNSQGNYSFESGQFVRYLIKVKSNLLSTRYKSQTFDFNSTRSPSDISPFSSTIDQFKWFATCDDKGGCIGVSSQDGNPLNFSLKYNGFLIGPGGGQISFDYKLDNMLVEVNVSDQKGWTYYTSFGGRSIPWTNFNLIKIPSSDYDRVVNLNFTFKNYCFYNYCSSSGQGLQPFYFYLDNLSINLNDAGKPLVGIVADPLPKVGDLQAVDFFPNLYPSKDKEQGKTKYDELSKDNKSEWIVGPRDLDDKEIMNLQNWSAFKLCDEYYQAWQKNEDYKGYPVPIKGQLDIIAETESGKPCIDFSWQYKDILTFRNLTIPYYDENKALYIRYSFKVK
jgi:hypothetical protein